MNSKEITGMIAVFDNAALNARFDYTIDLTTNKVTYVVACHWKRSTAKCRGGVFGKTKFETYKDAKIIFDGIIDFANIEASAA